MDSKFLVSLGDKQYPLYAGVLAEAHERGLQAIETQLIQIPGADNDYVAIVKATVRMKDGSVFEEYGDSSPRNCSSKIATALIRMAATRGKGRALRDACNIGQTLLEELPDGEDNPAPKPNGGTAPPPRYTKPPQAGYKGGQATAPPVTRVPVRQAEMGDVKLLTMPDGRALTLKQILGGWERAERDAKACGITPPNLELLDCEPEDVYQAAMELAHEVSEKRKNAAA